MNPFHVVHLAAEKLTWCRQRLQRETTGRRGRKDNPLYKHRRALLTRTDFLTERQKQRLDLLWDTDNDYAARQVTWTFYKDLISAYGHPDNSREKKLMGRVIDTLRKGLPAGLEELAQLGQTLWRRRAVILAYFDIGASNRPVEAIDGRLEHLRGIALELRNLDHYILRSLIHSGQLQDRINALYNAKSRISYSRASGRWITSTAGIRSNDRKICTRTQRSQLVVRVRPGGIVVVPERHLQRRQDLVIAIDSARGRWCLLASMADRSTHSTENTGVYLEDRLSRPWSRAPTLRLRLVVLVSRAPNSAVQRNF